MCNYKAMSIHPSPLYAVQRSGQRLVDPAGRDLSPDSLAKIARKAVSESKVDHDRGRYQILISEYTHHNYTHIPQPNINK